MAEKFWNHLKLKNGDKVRFVPPAPNGEQLGGITQEEREEISELKEDIATVNNDGETPVEAGKVWTSTADGAEWAVPQGGGGVTDVRVLDESVVTDGVANLPIANSNQKIGLVRTNFAYGIEAFGNGYLGIPNPTDDKIAKRLSYIPITAAKLNLAVTAALTDANHITLTADQQQTAQEVLGIYVVTQEEYDLIEDAETNGNIYFIKG